MGRRGDAAGDCNFHRTICKSAAEWKRIREQHLRDAKEMIDRPVIETRKGD